MRVAIISDIHANMQALEAVMDDINSQKCERVLCLGDLAMAGPQPNLVIDFVRKQTNWTVIQGNTDKLIADYSKELIENLKSQFPVMAHALVDDVCILDADKKEYLKNLPQQLNLDIEGVKVLMVHGSPRRNNEDILPDFPLEKVEEIISGVDADLIFCGHTHVPCGYQTKSRKTVVNVGSVGRPMTKNPQSCYVVADFNNGSFTIEHRFVDYDREKSAEIVKSRGFEGSEKLAEMILHPTDRHA
jgi:putative phosphoesterase